MFQKSTFDFLSELKENNTREWFEANKKRYEAAKKNVAAITDELIGRITAFDGNLAGLEAKDSMFRIFRDVRFSNDKSPYKVNMGAWMARGGRKSPFAGYYLHIEPGDKSFVAGGSYMPEPHILKAIRDAIDFQPEEFAEIVEADSFKKLFGGLEGEKLKTPPKGYPKDHPALEYLKHKSLVVSRYFKDKEILSGEFLDLATEAYQEMATLNQFLNQAIAEVSE